MNFRFQLLILLVCLTQIIRSQIFTEVSASLGLDHYAINQQYMGGGLGFADFNTDGWEDLYVCGGAQPDKIYLNNQGQDFTELVNPGMAATANTITNGIALGDIDNDGDKDVFITTGYIHESTPNLLFLNNGDSTFTDISTSSGIDIDTSWSSVATLGDYNLDGWLDIYVGNYIDTIKFIFDENDDVIAFGHVGFENKLFINNGDLTFTESSIGYGVNNNGNALGLASSDYDLDFDVDLYVANDFGSGFLGNCFYENMLPIDTLACLPDGNGSDISIFAMGVAVGDYDEDLDLDYYVTNLGANSLLQNNADNTFSDVALASGTINSHVLDKFATGWGTAFLDVDNDSYLDLLVANGHIYAAEIIANTILDPNKLYKNNGDGTFTDISDSSNVSDTGRSRGLAYCDFDKDGDLDFATGQIYIDHEPNKKINFYRNDSSVGNWLKIDLEGTKNNRDAYGAKVYVSANGRTFLQEVDGGSSHGSKHSDILHFGLDTMSHIDAISVVWPGGVIQHVSPSIVNSTIHIIEDQSLYPPPDPHIIINKSGIIFQVSPTGNHITVVNTGNHNSITVLNHLGESLYSTTIPAIHQIIDQSIIEEAYTIRVENTQSSTLFFQNILTN